MAADKLIAVNGACFAVLFNNNGANPAIPFQRGELLPQFELNPLDNTPTGKMRLFSVRDINAPVINFQLYSDYINGTTGLAFASLADLITFCENYIFKGADSTTPVPQLSVMQWKIKAAPAAANEKPTGATLQDDIYKTYQAAYMLINTDNYAYGVNMDQVVGTGTLVTDGNPLTFEDGDIVTVIANLIP